MVFPPVFQVFLPFSTGLPSVGGAAAAPGPWTQGHWRQRSSSARAAMEVAQVRMGRGFPLGGDGKAK